MDRRESASLISIGCNILLVALKLFGASLSGSIALLADAWHSSSDIAVSILVWVGIKITGPKEGPRKEEGVIENGVAIIISLAIFYAAFAVFRKIFAETGYQIRQVPVAIAITLVCILISLFISRYKTYVGRETNSLSLIADGQHSRMDMYTSIGVLVVLVGSMIGIPLDKTIAVVIAILIIKVGYDVFRLAIQGLKSGELLRFRPSGGGATPGFGRLSRVLGRVGDGIRRRRGGVCAVLALFLLGCYLLTGASVVGPAERGLLQRFGRFVGDMKKPGLHYHRPFPVETMVRMEPELVRRLEFGFRTTKSDQGNSIDESLVFSREPQVYEWESRHTTGRYRKVIDEALMLTGDENIIDINFILHYRVKDMKKFLVNVSDEGKLLRAVTESAVRLIVGKDELDHILTTDRAYLQEHLRQSMQEHLDQLDVGVDVVDICLQDVHPPIEVVSSFRDVASAGEDRSRMINEAIAQQNDAIPRARGDAARELATAEAYKHASVEKSKGDVSYYLAVLSAYDENPDMTRFRLVWEGIEKALKPVEKFFYRPDTVEGTQLWLMPMGKEKYPLEDLMRYTE